jgi:hypothetical protein
MTEINAFDCHRIAGGSSTGEALISKDDICFYMVDPGSGVVIEKGHDLEGRSVAGRVLIFPSGKGSSVVQTDGLYQLQLKGNAPNALIIRHADTVLVASSILMGIPVVNRLEESFYGIVRNGMRVAVDADQQRVAVVTRPGSRV